MQKIKIFSCFIVHIKRYRNASCWIMDDEHGESFWISLYWHCGYEDTTIEVLMGIFVSAQIKNRFYSLGITVEVLIFVLGVTYDFSAPHWIVPK